MKKLLKNCLYKVLYKIDIKSVQLETYNLNKTFNAVMKLKKKEECLLKF